MGQIFEVFAQTIFLFTFVKKGSYNTVFAAFSKI